MIVDRTGYTHMVWACVPQTESGEYGIIYKKLNPQLQSVVDALTTFLIIGSIALIAVVIITLHQKFKANTTEQSIGEKIRTRRKASGKLKEVVYRQPRDDPSARSSATQAASPIHASCGACGQPVPKGYEKAMYCVYCGKPMP